jgi:predicted AAA+ superfamily ATPase
MALEKLLELSSLVRSQGVGTRRERDILTQVVVPHSDRTYLGLCGPRGAGKTIMLRQLLLREPTAVYISLDTLPPDFDLFDAVKTLSKSYGFQTFLLDEVHFNRAIDSHLKACFDFLDVRVVFTSSVALQMFKSAQDLSRRVKLVYIPYFSLREYALFKHGETLAAVTLRELLSDPLKPDYAKSDTYLRGNYSGHTA